MQLTSGLTSLYYKLDSLKELAVLCLKFNLLSHYNKLDVPPFSKDILPLDSLFESPVSSNSSLCFFFLGE